MTQKQIFGLLFIFSACLLLQHQVFGQLQLTPIAQYAQPNAKAGRTETTGCPNDTARLELPFFDDFASTKKGTADTSKWQCGSGTYINNNLCINPLSFNVASFDGIAANGQPYNFEVPISVGTADMLTTKPINLLYGAGTSRVVLSFYLQPQGYGERPDKGDNFVVLGKTVNNTWDIIRQYEVRDNWKDFEYQSIPVIEAKFFHENFQLRFQVTTRLSGLYDVWNLDYVYLDKDRDASKESLTDMSMSKAPEYLLKNYTAMPISHFYEKNSIKDTINATMNQLNADNPNPLFYKMVLRDVLTKEFFGNLLGRDSSILAKASAKQIVLRGFMKDVKVPQNKKKLHLQTEIWMQTGEVISTHGFNTRPNDTLGTTTVLDNYYAYDDGSAEYGASFNQKFGKIACEFDNIKQDKLTHIDLLFVPLGMNIKGETYNLYVWQKINIGGGSNKDSTLLVQNIILSYADSTNKFTRIALNRPIDMKLGKFYIGVEQLSDKNLTFGYDKNLDNSQKIYVNVANQWQQAKNIPGSLMIRPVFGANTITALDEDLTAEKEILIYPNPTSGEITIADETTENVQVYNLLGQLQTEKHFEFGEPIHLNLSHLPSGMYVLVIKNKQKVRIEKVLIK